jgi:hypothetical protein
MQRLAAAAVAVTSALVMVLAACNSGKAPPAPSASATGAAVPQALAIVPVAPFPSSASAAASASPGPASAPSAQDPASPLHLGAPITGTKTVALSDIAKSPKTYANQVVTTSGTVFAVCQSMGCWMEIKDDKSEAHVKLAGHSFFVPKSSAGHHARVQAKVLRTNPDDECAQEAAEQTGKPVAKLELEATGVELD